MSSPAARARPSRFSPAWWVTDRDGDIAIAHWPNPAILVWFTAVVVGWTGVLDGETEQRVRYAGTGALVVWGLDELVRGSSPLRRVLGAVVLGFELVRLLA